MPQVAAVATVEDVTGVLSIFEAVALKMLELIGNVVTIVMENPLLLIPIGIVFTYAIINVFRKLF